MDYYQSVEPNPDAYPSLARTENGRWERYRYGLGQWTEDIHVQGDAVMSGNWEPTTADVADESIRRFTAITS